MSVDTRGREASERALAAVDRIDVPVISALLTRRRRLHLNRIVAVTVASVLVVAAGFVAVIDTANDPARNSRVQVQPTTQSIAKAEIEFREVRLTVPLIGNLAGPSCPAPSALFSPPEGEMFADRTGKTCYILGPVLLTGAGIDSASVVHDTTSAEWLVDTKWNNDEFVTKIAEPLVGRQIAIVSNGIVRSTPTINPGITGRDAEISGNLSQVDAIDLAASMMGIAPSAVHVDNSGESP